VAFTFLPDQSEDAYSWALAQLKSVFTSNLIPLPAVISTDCDQGLRNALSSIFPESMAVLCLWHANKNIQEHCKGYFTTAEAYNDFFQAWLSIVRSSSLTEYNERLLQFKTQYSEPPEHAQCVQYIQSTWLRPGRIEGLVQAWTNSYTHFGVTVTSRLVKLMY
jgi:transposase-like protein